MSRVITFVEFDYKSCLNDLILRLNCLTSYFNYLRMICEYFIVVFNYFYYNKMWVRDVTSHKDKNVWEKLIVNK